MLNKRVVSPAMFSPCVEGTGPLDPSLFGMAMDVALRGPSAADSIPREYFIGEKLVSGLALSSEIRAAAVSAGEELVPAGRQFWFEVGQTGEIGRDADFVLQRNVFEEASVVIIPFYTKRQSKARQSGMSSRSTCSRERYSSGHPCTRICDGRHITLERSSFFATSTVNALGGRTLTKCGTRSLSRDQSLT